MRPLPILRGASGTARRPVAVLSALCLCAAVTIAAPDVAIAAPAAVTAAAPARSLDDPAVLDLAWRIVASAEYSTLDRDVTYAAVADIGDGRGWTAGTIGFTTATGDLLEVVRRYTRARPANALARFLPALAAAVGSDTHAGLGRPFQRAWREAAADPAMRAAQDAVAVREVVSPALRLARADGLGALGQFVYLDALVMHGPGHDAASFGGIRRAALRHALPPSRGGDETAWLDAVLDARVRVMRQEEAHADTSRVDTAQRVFLRAGNLDLHLPLVWHVYGDRYELPA